MQWREGGHIYWHAPRRAACSSAVDGAEVCVTVTIVDGLVLGALRLPSFRPIYRSVMVKGYAHKIIDKIEKEARLRSFVERIIPAAGDAPADEWQN